MKLFRKIRQKLINQGNLKRYIPYAIGEILLVMIGILLAFQVSKWNDNRIKKDNEITYYKNIKDQINDDKTLIQSQIDYNSRFLNQFKFANNIIERNERANKDTLGIIIRNLISYSDFDRRGSIYETMVNSGEIKLLKNIEIINLIRILEERYNYMNRMEEIHKNVVLNYSAPMISQLISFSNNEIMEIDEVFSFEMQNLILIMIQISEEKNYVYTSSINYIDNTLELIDKELEK
ncbi:MAG: hypothetical protein HKO92_03275 [Flavobacteriaceae bacterium]|nr:hypothetical protein [Flavobacteriaceae bacterium]